jgi:hypothetical protein
MGIILGKNDTNMTVSELIEKLNAMPQDTIVVVENDEFGCFYDAKVSEEWLLMGSLGIHERFDDRYHKDWNRKLVIVITHDM